MPCYQVNLVSVEFKASNLMMLERATKALKLNFVRTGNNIVMGDMQFNTTTNQITGRQENINQLKREYSRQTVQTMALKNGWTIQKKTVNNQYQLVKY